MSGNLPRYLLDRRKAYLLKCCKVVDVEEEVYHGSPIQGMKSMMQGIVAPKHNELSGPLLSVSLNDNMLRFFGEEDGVSGFVFNLKAKCLVLDWFHQALLNAAESSYDMWAGYLKKFPQAGDMARVLGYGKWEREQQIHWREFEQILPPGVEGICLLGWDEQSAYNHEAEIALRQSACDRLLDHIESIVLKKVWLDPEEGKRRLDAIPWEGEDQVAPWPKSKAIAQQELALV